MVDAVGMPRMPGKGLVLIHNGSFGHPAQRTTCASGFECADLAALSTAEPGPRRWEKCPGARNAKGFWWVWSASHRQCRARGRGRKSTHQLSCRLVFC